MKKKTLTKNPNSFIYWIFRVICKIYSKINYNLHCQVNEINKTKSPAVIIANHGMSTDFMTLASVCKRKVNFVISNSFYQTINIKKLFDSVGIIPKQQFQTSILDMKKMKEVVDNGRVLAIYPAGLMTENGVSTPIPLSTGKFLKWLNQDVYIAYSIGDYLSNPKWAKITRKGRIDLSIKRLITKEELQELSIDKLNELIIDKLSFNEYDSQEIRKQIYKNGDNIEGLENVLYKCPRCQKEHQMKVINQKLICENCGNTVYSDKYGFLHPQTDDICYRHVNDWYSYIEKELIKEIDANNSFILTSEVKIHMIDYKKHKFVYKGEGKLTLNKDCFTLVGMINDEKVEKNIGLTPSTPFKTGECIELQEKEKIYRLYLQNGNEVMKWIMALKYFYQRKNKE